MARFLLHLALFTTLLAGACTTQLPEDPVDPSYEHVERIMRRSCTFSASCHGGESAGQAHMNMGIALEECSPITDVLFLSASEYPPMHRVEPGDPDHSFIMYKLDGAHDDARNLIFTPDPAWVAGLPPDAGRYILHNDGGGISFGVIMPQVAGEALPANDIISIREWIAAGAPHPDVLPDCDAGPPLPDLGPRDAGMPDLGTLDLGTPDAPTDAPVDAAAMDAAMDAGIDADIDASD